MASFNTKFLASLLERVYSGGDEVEDALKRMQELAIPLYVEDELKFYSKLKQLCANPEMKRLIRPILKKVDAQKDEERLTREKAERKAEKKAAKKKKKAKSFEEEDLLQAELQKKKEAMKKGLQNALEKKNRKRQAEDPVGPSKPAKTPNPTSSEASDNSSSSSAAAPKIVAPKKSQQTPLYKKCLKMRQNMNRPN